MCCCRRVAGRAVAPPHTRSGAVTPFRNRRRDSKVGRWGFVRVRCLWSKQKHRPVDDLVFRQVRVFEKGVDRLIDGMGHSTGTLYVRVADDIRRTDESVADERERQADHVIACVLYQLSTEHRKEKENHHSGREHTHNRSLSLLLVAFCTTTSPNTRTLWHRLDARREERKVKRQRHPGVKGRGLRAARDLDPDARQGCRMYI